MPEHGIKHVRNKQVRSCLDNYFLITLNKPSKCLVISAYSVLPLLLRLSAAASYSVQHSSLILHCNITGKEYKTTQPQAPIMQPRHANGGSGKGEAYLMPCHAMA